MTREDLEQGMHDLEKRAMCGDRNAVLRIISVRRSIYQAAIAMLATRYADGECDAVALHSFEDAVEEAHEAALADEDT